jgi:choline dehydrogenase
LHRTDNMVIFALPSPRILALAAVSLPFSHCFAIPRSAYQARRVDPSHLLAEYDYVIVGGGTAGLTVADRLTEDESITVLVIESGIFADDEIVLPVLGGGTQLQPQYEFDSAPQPNLRGRKFTVRLGNMVGGSSGSNGMMSVRGSAEDYDRWGQLFDQDEYGWNWEGLLPYFKKVNTHSPVLSSAK